MVIALRSEAGRGRRYAARLRADARRLLAACGLGACELSVVIAGDEFVRALNRDFRGKDRATDVLSFSLLEEAVEPAQRAATPRAARVGDAGDGAAGVGRGVCRAPRPPGRLPAGAQAGMLTPRPGMLLGDVVISADTAERQARRLGVEVAARMRALLVHGVLHLLGYDHERSPAEARRMFARERELAATLAGAVGGAAARARGCRRPAHGAGRRRSR